MRASDAWSSQLRPWLNAGQPPAAQVPQHVTTNSGGIARALVAWPNVGLVYARAPSLMSSFGGLFGICQVMGAKLVPIFLLPSIEHFPKTLVHWKMDEQVILYSGNVSVLLLMSDRPSKGADIRPSLKNSNVWRPGFKNLKGSNPKSQLNSITWLA